MTLTATQITVDFNGAITGYGSTSEFDSYVFLDPVVGGLVGGNPKVPLTADSPLNALYNPAAIAIPDRGTPLSDDTSAIYELPPYNAGDMMGDSGAWGISSDDPRIQWSIATPAGGNGSADFYNSDDTGAEFQVYGQCEGDVLLNGAINGIPMISIRSAVVANHYIPFRMNFLESGDLAHPNPWTLDDGQGAEDAIAVANVILRQAGITLVPDTNTTINAASLQHGETATAIAGYPGYFEIDGLNGENSVYLNVAGNDINPLQPAHFASQMNYNQNVINFNVVTSITDGNYGYTEYLEANRYSPRLQDALNEYSRVVPSMNLLAQNTGPTYVGIIIDGTAAANEDADPSTYAVWNGITLAHEALHGLGLAHRGADDGLRADNRNLMIAGPVGNLGSVDIDLLQLRAIQGSAIY